MKNDEQEKRAEQEVEDGGDLLSTQGRVVRKPVNVNPVLNFNSSVTFSCLRMFSTSNSWCSLRLTQLKTEGQTI